MRKLFNLWEKYLPEKDLKIYSTAGFGKQIDFGTRCALLIIDVIYGFTGDRPEPIEESIKKYPLSCGLESWESIKYIKKLLEVSRRFNIPVIYTTTEGQADGQNEWIGLKSNFFDHPLMKKGQKGSRIVEDIKPLSGDLVLNKMKPSAFFGTPLVSYLMSLNIDTVIITGCTTSGCIRATALDAFSFNYKVFIPYECVFDRSHVSHAINLFDIHQKYGEVITTDSVINKIIEHKDLQSS